jgi:hypothetical protein
MAIPEKMIEAFLTFWYPGEWPDNLGLTGGTEADDPFKVRCRKECREGLEAAGVGELIEALEALEEYCDNPSIDNTQEAEDKMRAVLAKIRGTEP